MVVKHNISGPAYYSFYSVNGKMYAISVGQWIIILEKVGITLSHLLRCWLDHKGPILNFTIQQ